MNYNFKAPQTIVLKNTLSATSTDLVLDDAGSRTGPFQVAYGVTAYRSADISFQYYKEKLWTTLAAGDTAALTASSSEELAYYTKLAASVDGLTLYLLDIVTSAFSIVNSTVLKVTSTASGGAGTYTYAWTVSQADTYVALTGTTSAQVTITADAEKVGTSTITCTATDSTTHETITDVITVTVTA